MSKKTKLIAIIDNSSYGYSMGGESKFGTTEMEISQQCERDIRRMFQGAEKYVKCVEGDPRSGNSVFSVNVEEESIGRYEFKKQGKTRFLNVTANPTKLASGMNDIPVLITGCEHYITGNNNSALTTFMYLNRLPYILLEHIPSTSPFKWEGRMLKDLQNGNINISRYQLAWYSGDLGSQRDNVFWYLRACYTGSHGSFDNGRYENLSAALGLSAKSHDNHHGNLTIEKKYESYNKLFSLTIYSKSEQPGYVSTQEKRVDNLLRYDCTFSHQFLKNHKISKLDALEDRYKGLCETGGYDLGFIGWLRKEVYDALYLDYILTLDSDKYKDMIQKMEDITGKNERKIAQYWLNFDNTFADKNLEQLGKELDIDPSNLSRSKKDVQRKTGVVLNIPRRYILNMLWNRVGYQLTDSEREAYVLKHNGNKRVNFDDAIERDIERLSKVQTALNTAVGLISRRFKPIKLQVETLWFRKQFRGEK